MLCPSRNTYGQEKNCMPGSRVSCIAGITVISVTCSPHGRAGWRSVGLIALLILLILYYPKPISDQKLSIRTLTASCDPMASSDQHQTISFSLIQSSTPKIMTATVAIYSLL